MKERTVYTIKAIRSPYEIWSAWTETTDPKKAEEHLANVERAGFEGMIEIKTYPMEESNNDLHRN